MPNAASKTFQRVNVNTPSDTFTLEALCASGYLTIEDLIPVPEDITGYPSTVVGVPPCDPSPFSHPTKIVILRVRRK